MRRGRRWPTLIGAWGKVGKLLVTISRLRYRTVKISSGFGSGSECTLTVRSTSVDTNVKVLEINHQASCVSQLRSTRVLCHYEVAPVNFGPLTKNIYRGI